MKYLMNLEKRLIFKEVDKDIYGVPVLRVLPIDRFGGEKLFFDEYTISDYEKNKPYKESYKYEFDKIYDVLEKDEEKARALAKEKFKGKKDKAGKDYYEYHLCIVCRNVKTKPARIVALLHDILEDTIVSLLLIYMNWYIIMYAYISNFSNNKNKKNKEVFL